MCADDAFERDRSHRGLAARRAPKRARARLIQSIVSITPPLPSSFPPLLGGALFLFQQHKTPPRSRAADRERAPNLSCGRHTPAWRAPPAPALGAPSPPPPTPPPPPPPAPGVRRKAQGQQLRPGAPSRSACGASDPLFDLKPPLLDCLPPPPLRAAAPRAAKPMRCRVTLHCASVLVSLTTTTDSFY